MIEKLNDIEALNCFDDCLSVKIRALFKAYGNEFSLGSFYCQKNEEGKPTAVISRYNGSLTISKICCADKNELVAFIEFLSPFEIICNIDLAEALNKEYKKIYSVCSFSTASEQKQTELSFCQFKGIYSHFSQGDEDISVGRFDDWYADINHRIRHNACKAFHNASASAIVFSDDLNGLLNGIAVDKAVRSKGEGSKMLSCILSSPDISKLYAFCSDKALRFYLKNGFEIESEIALIKRF